jgi:putative redox protein
MTVNADCSAPDELEKLVTIAKRSCIASNTLSKSVQLTVECG